MLYFVMQCSKNPELDHNLSVLLIQHVFLVAVYMFKCKTFCILVDFEPSTFIVCTVCAVILSSTMVRLLQFLKCLVGRLYGPRFKLVNGYLAWVSCEYRVQGWVQSC